MLACKRSGTVIDVSDLQALEWLDGTLMWRSLLRLGGVEHVDCYDSRFMLRFLASLVESGSDVSLCVYQFSPLKQLFKC